MANIWDKIYGTEEVVVPTDVAAAGNGGGANATANGGAVATGDLNTGGNTGSAIGVGDSVGDVSVDGGAMANTANISAAASGGTAIADASGGNYNVAFVS
ncbi:MAG: hypothetical protein ACKOCK_05145 [Chloroflexota bacterium]